MIWPGIHLNVLFEPDANILASTNFVLFMQALTHQATLAMIGSSKGRFHLITMADATQPSTKRTQGEG